MTAPGRMPRWVGLVLTAGFAWAAATTGGDDPDSQRALDAPVIGTATGGRTPAQDQDLAVDQGRLSDRFGRLEQVLLRLSELTAASNPRRAALLREAIARSKQRDIHTRFEAVVQLLEEDRLAIAAKNQDQLQQELSGLLQLMLKENRAERVESDKRRVHRYLKELNRLIKTQRDVRARTEGNGDTRPLAQAQGTLAEKTGKLARGMATDQEQGSDRQRGTGAPAGKQPPRQGAQGAGDPEESSERPPGQQTIGSANRRIGAAEKEMERAREKLEEAKRQDATQDQRAALDELQKAKAVLEQILRQLREQQIEQMLVRLETRFRKMLAQQLEVYDGTKKLDKIPRDQRDHDDQIAAGRLSRTEALIVGEADKALMLLGEEGSSVAFPEVVQQMRGEMQEVTTRLQKMMVGMITQDLEQGIISALEDTILALRKTLEEMESRKSQSGQPRLAGQALEPPLVDLLAELRMIRSLQLRVNRQTERYRQLLAGSTAQRPELVEALRRLSERQQRIHRATRDLHLGRNR